MKKAILLLIAIVLTLSIFIVASAPLPVGTEICAENNESSLQASAMLAQGGVGNYSKGDTSNITPVAVSADTGDNLGTPAKKMLNDAPSNESDLVKRIVDDEGREIDLVSVPGVPPEERISGPPVSLVKRFVDDEGRELDEVRVPGVPPEERISEPPVSLVKRFVDDEGRELDEVRVPGVPPEERISEPPVSSSEIMRADATLSNVPAFDWCYGCHATSAAMLFGYYDRTGYPNMYTGPTNGGVCPLTNSVWGVGECPLSATHQGVDGLAVKGHVDDYWSTFGSTVDPYYGHWTEHGYADCTADFMGTNQYVNWQNIDGDTRFFYSPSGAPVCDYTGCEPGGKRDGCHGIRLFVESRGYNVVQNCNQYIDENVTGGFTYANFKAEIDAGRPVLIHVEGHTMLGYGYNDPDTIYIHDTWGYTVHSMTWGGSYSGKQHYGVTFIQLEPSTPPPGEDIAVFSNGVWCVDTTGNHIADLVFGYGIPGDIPLVGNFGSDDIAIFRNGMWCVDTTGNHIADLVFGYGIAGDVPLVGDIDQDGTDDIAIFRNGLWCVDTTGNHIADVVFGYGIAGDIPLVGDIDQDGTDDTAIFRNGLWCVDTTGNHIADLVFGYGIAGDVPLVGDINKDETDDIAIFRNGLWCVDTTGNRIADLVFGYGLAGDVPLVGNMG